MIDETRLSELVSMWQRLRQQGAAPSSAELCRDCPALLPELERRLQGLTEMSRSPADSNSTLPPSDSLPPTEPMLPSTVLKAPALPGYEILGELGRGGMGVVYKARDLNLKRVVALKMILAGGHAGAEQLARFHREAEAVARLRHSHIVQVFAGGEHGGQPYFVLEFVEGGSLDRKLQGKPQPPRDAARLVLLLARAVHAAHAQGIIHRDLKPANVLLAPPADEPALNTPYGCPKVTDFGLVKCLDDAVEQTAAGTILGTPSYMAPEQASGDPQKIGPAADVYALGVILYELLTGKVPFKGPSVLDTLEQVRSHPPRPPRELLADVPPALEGICLRCLRKAPGERYPSAADLAEDLRRFLADEPTVAAPPVSSAAGRRRLAPLAALGAVLLLAVLLVVWLANRPAEVAPAPADRGKPPAPVAGEEKRPAVPARTLDGTLTLLVYPRGPDFNEWASADQKGVLPVRSGEQVRLEAKLSEPAHAYLLLLDSRGRAVPLYPWNEDRITVKDVAAPPPVRGPRTLVTTPTSATKGWRLDNESGLETIILLARREPLPAGVSLPALLGKLPAAQLRKKGELAVLAFDRGAPSPSTVRSLERGFEDEAREVDEPLVRLMERLRGTFEVVRAVRFAHQGE